MAMIPAPIVPAPLPLGRRYGLFTAASGPLVLPPHGVAGGVQYQPVTCGTARLWPIDCSGGVPENSAKEPDPNDESVTFEPFTVYSAMECGPVGYTPEEFQRRARLHLDNGDQGAVEFAVWSGVTDLGPDGLSLGIPNFVDEGVDIGAGESGDIAAVVSALEHWMYHVQGYGNVAYIHAPVSVAAWAAALYLVIKDGPLLRTPFGSVWVFGGGYPGTGPDNEEPPTGGAYLHITGQTAYYRSAEPWASPIDQTMNRVTNQRLALVEQEYAVTFDCAVGRTLFNPFGGS